MRKWKVVQVVLYDNMRSNIINNIDGFRFIKSLHTTARQLIVCSEIVKKLVGKQLPNEILSQLMLKWSIEEEENDEVYKISKGKLSDNGKQTTAFKNYLDLCNSLKMINHLNDFYSCSRLSYTFFYFLKQNNKKGLSLPEKIFYLLQLFWIDADGILYILDEIKISSRNQKDLQENFKMNFNNRLLVKQELANPIVKNMIGERYRTINYVWKNPKKYAEHLLIPRCEWLTSLGVLEIKKKGNFTIYDLTDKGRLFINKIPNLPNSILIDINEEWLFNQLFTAINQLYGEKNIKYFKDFNHQTKKSEIVIGLTNALKTIKTSNSFKIPLLDCLIFICIDFFCNRNTVIEMSEVLATLKEKIVSDSRSFSLVYEGRINESYIISNVVKL